MMWSQCRCDRNTWNTLGFEGPSFAKTRLPKARTPLPRSHMTYSAPPASSSPHGEVPPQVCDTVKASSLSTEVLAFSWVSRPLPAAATIARASLSLIDAELRETGIEPRVPQNVTHSAAMVRRYALHHRRQGRAEKSWPALRVRSRNIQKRD